MKLAVVAAVAAILLDGTGIAEAAARTGTLQQCMGYDIGIERLRACTTVINSSPPRAQLIRALDHRGLDYQALGQYPQAIDDFSRVIQLSPSIAGYYDNRQAVYRAMGRLDDALSDANQAVRLAPKEAFVYHSRATVLSAMGRFEDALVDYDAAIVADSASAFRYADKAAALLRLSRYQDAIDALTKGLEQSPSSPELLKARGLAEASAGQQAAAKADLGAYLAVQPNDVEASAAMNTLGTAASTSAPGPTPAVASPSAAPAVTPAIRVQLTENGGVFVTPVKINGAIVLDFLVDSGATDVTIPADVFSTLVRTGTITDSDLTGSVTYTLADGSSAPSQTFRIRSLQVGDQIVENVSASVAPQKGPLLLGQSFLSRFGSWSIDNTSHSLILIPGNALAGKN